jgi:hypothetical protein
MMTSEGTAASASLSSAARRWACTASVSKLKGRMMRVAGSSFITSTKTISAAVRIEGRRIGRWTPRSIPVGVLPSVRATASILGFTVASPAS